MSFSFFSKKKTLNKEQIERVDQLPSTSRLSNLAATLKGTLKTILNKHPKFDKNFFDELEDQLILADIGVELTTKLIDKLKVETKQRKLSEADEVIEFLKETLLAILITNIGEPVIEAESSTTLKVILFIGVNGTGKTTSIGKLAAQLSSTGKSVLLAAGDTFRAAAIEQLEVWAERVGCDLIKNQQGSDSAALVFDSIDAAIARGKNILIVDTAGRLHNKGNLMNELLKIKKIIDKKANNIANESLLVLDATTGQNGLNQAVEFSENIGITGIILTKLDGVAKGGVLFNIVDRLKLPIKYIGVGEAIEDLQLFNPSEFVEQIFQ